MKNDKIEETKKAKDNKVVSIIKILTIVIMAIIIAITGYKELKKVQEKIDQQHNKDIEWIRNNVKIKKSSFNSSVLKVEKNSKINIYNNLYQQVIDEKINKMIEENYTFENPLIIYNPYGTNTTSFNIYFNTDENLMMSYTISVDEDDIKDYTAVLKNDGANNLTKKHNYQIIGFIPEKKNTLTLTLKDQDGNVKDTKIIKIDMIEVKTTVETKLKTSTTQTENLSKGLYTMFGHDKNYNANNYLYDNNGILRAELVLNSYRSDRIIFTEDDMIYSYSKTKIARVNKLGKVIQTYNLGKYYMHHDYILDEENNKLLILANKTGANTIEDIVISLDLDTGKVKEEINIKDYLEEMYKIAIPPKDGNTYGGTELDWLHLNSIQIIDGKDIILSSRELSTIIYVEDLYNNPNIKYLISDESMYEDTSYKSLLLEKKGTFTSNAGQHSLIYSKDSSLQEYEYYIEMYNNNYGAARTKPNFDWSNYEGVGTYLEGDKSMYYKYLINEKEKTYELVEKVELPYSSIVSSVQKKDNNLITSSGMSHVFNEYDEDGNLIKEFSYNSKKYAYRVYKYDFSNWFYNN